jgi:branched-chain amino acid transport system substrate-binding protein
MKRDSLALVRTRTLLALAVLATTALTAAAAATAAPRATTITIGGLFTTSGSLAPNGQGNLDGFEFYWKNVAKWKAGSTTVKFVNADDAGDPATALSKLQALTGQSGAKIVVGTVSSAVAAAVKNYTEANKLPYVITQAAASAITGTGSTAHTVRVIATFRQSMMPFTRYVVRKKKVNKIIFMGSDYSAGRDAEQAVKDAAGQVGAQVVQSVFAPLGTTDFGPYLSKVDASAGQAVVAFFGGTDAVNFVRQYQSFGLKGKLPLYGHWALNIGPIGTAQGAAGTDITTVTEYESTIKNPQNVAFVKQWRKIMKTEPNGWNVQGYAAAAAIATAIKATNGSDDGDRLGAALHDVKLKLPQGTLRFDAKGQVLPPFYVATAKLVKGKLDNQIVAGLGAVAEG